MIEGFNEQGWYIRHSHPYWFVRSLATEAGVTSMNIWGSIPTEMHAPIAEVMIRGFLRKSLEYDINEWPRGQLHHQLEPSNYTPVPHDGRGDIFEDRFNYADNFYRIIPEFLDRGVAPSLLDSLAQWGEQLWPNGDWENLVDYTDTGDGGEKPIVSLTLDGGNAEASENGGETGKAKILINRSGTTGSALTIPFSLTGTAINGTDYTTSSSPLTMAAGQSQIAISINPIDDSRIEGDETIVISLQSTNDFVIDSGGGTVTVTLKDNDNGNPFAFGDVTGDGSVSALDAAFVLQHVAQVIVLEGEAESSADVSGDLDISAFDASLILQYITGLIECFPAEANCSASKLSERR